MSVPVNSTFRSGRKVALVTGASSGIGREIALLLAAEGYDLVLCARRLGMLEELAAEIERTSASRCVVIQSDLGQTDGAAKLAQRVREMGIEIDYLVNNAGVTVEGRYLDNPWEAHRNMVQLMSLAPAELIHHFLPGMLARREGKILNVASLGAFWPCFPCITLYAGAKNFLVRLTNTLAAEYPNSGVTFSVVCPFTTRTAFIDTPTTREITARMPQFMIQSAQTVARIGLEGVKAGRTVQHTSLLNHFLALLLTFLPARLVGSAIVRYMAIAHKNLR